MLQIRNAANFNAHIPDGTASLTAYIASTDQGCIKPMPTQRRGVVFTDADKVAAAMMLHVAATKGWRSAFLQHSSGYAEVLLLFSPKCIEPAHIVTRLDVRTVAVLDASSLVAIGRFPTLIDALGEVSKLAADQTELNEQSVAR